MLSLIIHIKKAIYDHIVTEQSKVEIKQSSKNHLEMEFHLGW